MRLLRAKVLVMAKQLRENRKDDAQRPGTDADSSEVLVQPPTK